MLTWSNTSTCGKVKANWMRAKLEEWFRGLKEAEKAQEEEDREGEDLPC